MAKALADITIGGIDIAPGERKVIDIRVAPMYTHDDISIAVQAVRGRRPGPTLFISAAIHGDEINGVEIIRRLLQHKALNTLRGTLLAVDRKHRRSGRSANVLRLSRVRTPTR